MSRREIILLRQALALVPQSPRIKELLAKANSEAAVFTPIRMRAGLTPNQEKVVALLKQGLTFAEVEKRTDLGRGGLQFHLTPIYLHYGVETSHGLLTKILSRKTDEDLGECFRRLSLRERRIFDLFCEGYGNFEIGILEQVANKTVAYHMTAIYRKFGLRAGFKEKRLGLVWLVFEPGRLGVVLKPKVVEKGPGPLPVGSV